MDDDEVVKVNKEMILSCMKCSLCGHLFTEATTISECLHTFCKKCIYDKLEEDEEECCPVCNIHLGVSPLEKLRSDHNMDELKFKIFLSEANLGEKAVDVAPVVHPHDAEMAEADMTKTKKPEKHDAEMAEADVAKTRKPENEKCLTVDIDETINKDSTKDDQNPKEKPEESIGILDGISDLNEPLSSLVGKSASINEVYIRKRKGKETRKDVKNRVELAEPSNPTKPRRDPKKSIPKENLSAQKVAEVSSQKDVPIWISLLAAENQKGDNPLPQISSKYLMIKDRSTPVSYLRKYLMKKLDIKSEEEIEIRCFNETVYPEIKLKSLQHMWLNSMPPTRKGRAKVGEPAGDFVMVLTYERSQPCSNQIKIA